MPTERLSTDRLEVTPLPVHAAAAIPLDRLAAGRAVGARLSAQWPDPRLAGLFRRHAQTPAGAERFGVWVMIERDSATIVGDIGFHGPPDAAGVVEVGYNVVPSRRGRGYATEAARALAGWAKAQPDVRAVVAGCDPGNLASIIVLERAGFHRTGEADGEIRWRLEQ
jgi:RimJ/RimL family protein N-acetyltransferase